MAGAEQRQPLFGENLARHFFRHNRGEAQPEQEPFDALPEHRERLAEPDALRGPKRLGFRRRGHAREHAQAHEQRIEPRARNAGTPARQPRGALEQEIVGEAEPDQLAHAPPGLEQIGIMPQYGHFTGTPRRDGIRPRLESRQRAQDVCEPAVRVR